MISSKLRNSWKETWNWEPYGKSKREVQTPNTGLRSGTERENYSRRLVQDGHVLVLYIIMRVCASKLLTIRIRMTLKLFVSTYYFTSMKIQTLLRCHGIGGMSFSHNLTQKHQSNVPLCTATTAKRLTRIRSSLSKPIAQRMVSFGTEITETTDLMDISKKFKVPSSAMVLEDLCKALCQVSNDADCLGVLRNHQWQHYIYPAPSWKLSPGGYKLTTIEQILTQPGGNGIGTKDK